jgi:predicted MFS family arabinose efflux permease
LPGRWLVVGGILLSGAGIAMLLLPPTTPLLIVSGLLGGAGGGFVLTPLLVELSRRSDDADRGSAFSLFSASLAGALAIGSIGAAPIVATAGFEGAIVAGLVAMGGAAILSLADRQLARTPSRAAAT